MRSANGPTVEYELVCCLLPKTIHRLGDRFFEPVGRARGILVRSSGMMGTMYHMPEDYLAWKHNPIK